MSRECIFTCPDIQQAVEYYVPDVYPQLAARELLKACQASYDCPGARTGEEQVTVGLPFFRRKSIETRTISICGLTEVAEDSPE